MSGQRKKGKGKGKDTEGDVAGAFAVDFSMEKGKDIYIPGSFWGLAGDGAILAERRCASVRRCCDADYARTQRHRR